MMTKNKYKVDQDLLKDIQSETKKIEQKHHKQKKKRRQEKAEAEDLSQRWLAPMLLFATLAIAYLLYLIY